MAKLLTPHKKTKSHRRKRRRRLERVRGRNHNSTGGADPTIALHAALERMVEKTMRSEMTDLIAEQSISNHELQRLRAQLSPKEIHDPLQVDDAMMIQKLTHAKEVTLRDLKESQHTCTLSKEKALNKKLKDGEKCDNSSIGVKKIGELDVKVFKRACEKRFPVEEAEIRAVELCSTWQDMLRNLLEFPCRIASGDKWVVNEKDPRICELKNEWGDEAYNAVVTAFMDLHGYSKCERVKEYEVWNFKENRKAKVEEVISWLRSGRKELLESRYVVVSIK